MAAKQRATTRNKSAAAVIAEVDFRYGFPGKMPQSRNVADRQKLMKFFELLARGSNIRQAARDAGFSEKWAKQYSYGYVSEHEDYLTWLQAHFAQAAAQAAGVDEARVVDEMQAIALANDFDYIVVEQKAGKPSARRKLVHELSRDQMRAITVYETAAGELKWKFRDRDGKLQDLGRKLGFFNEKIIMEHRHRHLHAHVDLRNVPIEKLEALEGQFEQLLLEHKATERDEP